MHSLVASVYSSNLSLQAALFKLQDNLKVLAWPFSPSLNVWSNSMYFTAYNTKSIKNFIPLCIYLNCIEIHLCMIYLCIQGFKLLSHRLRSRKQTFSYFFDARLKFWALNRRFPSCFFCSQASSFSWVSIFQNGFSCSPKLRKIDYR